MIHRQGTREAYSYDNGDTSRSEDVINTSEGLLQEEVEFSVDEIDSSESEGNYESEGAERKPVNAEVDNAEMDDEAPFMFPRGDVARVPAADPVGRATQSPSLTPATALEERVATPVTASGKESRATSAAIDRECF